MSAAAAPKGWNEQKVIRIGDVAPDFDANTTKGHIKFHDYINGKWAVLFSHPADFTPVCTTELGRVAQLKEEWAKRNAVVIALSVDSVDNHTKWIADINDYNKVTVEYPIIADEDRKVAILYGMLDQSWIEQKTGMPVTVRSVYIIDPDKKVRIIITYPASTGRNFHEILRVIDSLQLAGSHKVATPADWERGKDTVVLPTVSTEDAQKLFQKVNVYRPWLRTTPDPLIHSGHAHAH